MKVGCPRALGPGNGESLTELVDLATTFVTYADHALQIVALAGCRPGHRVRLPIVDRRWLVARTRE